MPDSSSARPGPPGTSFADLFTPKLATVLREGYGLAHLRADAVAGLIASPCGRVKKYHPDRT